MQIADPYRWLEDADAEDTKQFVDAQNALTEPFLENCPLRGKLNGRCISLANLLHQIIYLTLLHAASSLVLRLPIGPIALLLLVCMSLTIIGQPRNSVLIRRV